MQTTEELGQAVGLRRAWETLGVNRAALYRRRDRQAGKCLCRLRPEPP